MKDKMYVCIECGYEWEVPFTDKCCPMCNSPCIDEIVDTQELGEETDAKEEETLD